jgi:hypothetical protein
MHGTYNMPKKKKKEDQSRFPSVLPAALPRFMKTSLTCPSYGFNQPESRSHSHNQVSLNNEAISLVLIRHNYKFHLSSPEVKLMLTKRAHQEHIVLVGSNLSNC